jgi:hypothetical protein
VTRSLQGHAPLAAQVRRDDRGDGVDLDLLAGRVLLLVEVVEVWLVNAAPIKAISRRKTDVKDAEWIARLLECGLLRPSFVPRAGDPPTADAHALPGAADGRPDPATVQRKSGWPRTCRGRR